MAIRIAGDAVAREPLGRRAIESILGCGQRLDAQALGVKPVVTTERRVVYVGFVVADRDTPGHLWVREPQRLYPCAWSSWLWR